MRVQNTHSAPVCGIAPGAEGDVDPNVAGNWVQLQAGHLKPLDGSVIPSEKPGARPLAPAGQPGDPEVVAEIERRDARIRELEAQLSATRNVAGVSPDARAESTATAPAPTGSATAPASPGGNPSNRQR